MKIYTCTHVRTKKEIGIGFTLLFIVQHVVHDDKDPMCL